MRLTVLGSSGTHPTAGNPASGYLVTEGDTVLLLDAGPGTFQPLLAHATPAELGAIVISHIHPDHCSDLFAAFHWLAYGPGGGPVEVFAAEGVAEAVAAFVAAEPGGALDRAFLFRTVAGGEEEVVGGLRLRFAAADHPVPTIATRVEGSRGAITYSSDTGPGGDAFTLAAGSDLFLCEATYGAGGQEEGYPHHLTAGEAARLAAAAGCRRLVLTHVRPGWDPAEVVAAASGFPGPVEAAIPGDTWEV